MRAIVIAVMCLVMLGCGEDKANNTSNPPPKPEQKFSTTIEWTEAAPNGELVWEGTVENLGPDTAYSVCALVNVPYESGMSLANPSTLVPSQIGTFTTNPLRSEGALDRHDVRVYWRPTAQRPTGSVQAQWSINETLHDVPFNSYKGWGTVTNYSDFEVYDVKVKLSNDSTFYIVPLRNTQWVLQPHEIAEFHTLEWIQAAGQIRVEVLWR